MPTLNLISTRSDSIKRIFKMCGFDYTDIRFLCCFNVGKLFNQYEMQIDPQEFVDIFPFKMDVKKTFNHTAHFACDKIKNFTFPAVKNYDERIHSPAVAVETLLSIYLGFSVGVIEDLDQKAKDNSYWQEIWENCSEINDWSGIAAYVVDCEFRQIPEFVHSADRLFEKKMRYIVEMLKSTGGMDEYLAIFKPVLPIYSNQSQSSFLFFESKSVVQRAKVVEAFILKDSVSLGI